MNMSHDADGVTLTDFTYDVFELIFNKIPCDVLFEMYKKLHNKNIRDCLIKHFKRMPITSIILKNHKKFIPMFNPRKLTLVFSKINHDSFIKNFTRISNLHFLNWDRHLLYEWKTLETLYINVSNVDDSCIIHVIKNNPYLEHLTLFNCYDIYGEFLTFVKNNLVTLRLNNLCFVKCKLLLTNFINVLQRNICLEHLEFAITRINDKTFYNLYDEIILAINVLRYLKILTIHFHKDARYLQKFLNCNVTRVNIIFTLDYCICNICKIRQCKCDHNILCGCNRCKNINCDCDACKANDCSCISKNIYITSTNLKTLVIKSDNYFGEYTKIFLHDNAPNLTRICLYGNIKLNYFTNSDTLNYKYSDICLSYTFIEVSEICPSLMTLKIKFIISELKPKDMILINEAMTERCSYPHYKNLTLKIFSTLYTKGKEKYGKYFGKFECKYCSIKPKNSYSY